MPTGYESEKHKKLKILGKKILKRLGYMGNEIFIDTNIYITLTDKDNKRIRTLSRRGDVIAIPSNRPILLYLSGGAWIECGAPTSWRFKKEFVKSLGFLFITLPYENHEKNIRMFFENTF